MRLRLRDEGRKSHNKTKTKAMKQTENKIKEAILYAIIDEPEDVMNDDSIGKVLPAMVVGRYAHDLAKEAILAVVNVAIEELGSDADLSKSDEFVKKAKGLKECHRLWNGLAIMESALDRACESVMEASLMAEKEEKANKEEAKPSVADLLGSISNRRAN